MTSMSIPGTARVKLIRVPGYTLVFDKETGFLARWGDSPDENPRFSPIGPEIADIEISTVCHGIGKTMETRTPCSWCYKSNTGTGENMTFETFRTILDKFPPTLAQIAFGVGDIDANRDLWRIMEHCRQNGVIPNITVNGMGVTDEVAERLAQVCGAVAVSHYGDDLCFDAVAKLRAAGLKQVNIHKLLAQETLDSCFLLVDKVATDARLRGLKAIVFLALKPKGCRNRFHTVSDLADYKALLKFARAKGVGVGMDSCSAPMALKSVEAEFHTSIEPCESGLFSIYVNVKGEVFPCSFTEGTPGWERGIDLVEAKSFLEDVWYNPRLVWWRRNLLKSSQDCECNLKQDCRSCPVFDITPCKPPFKQKENLVQIEAKHTTELRERVETLENDVAKLFASVFTDGKRGRGAGFRRLCLHTVQ